jgi:hypothetical protein
MLALTAYRISTVDIEPEKLIYCFVNALTALNAELDIDRREQFVTVMPSVLALTAHVAAVEGPRGERI